MVIEVRVVVAFVGREWTGRKFMGATEGAGTKPGESPPAAHVAFEHFTVYKLYF